MRIWADVYDVDGITRLKGPIFLLSMTLNRVLDGAGSFSLRAPLMNSRARDLLVPERRVDLYTELNDRPRLVGSGLITSVNTSVSSGQLVLDCSGPDLLQELKRKNTLLNRRFDTSFESIVQELAPLGGWTATVSGIWPGLSLRFDGQSALSAILTAASAVGAHVRIGDAEHELEVGAMGVEQDIFATNQTINSEAAILNDKLLLIDGVKVGRASEAVANWLIPLGGGEGEAALTLEKSTRSPIFSMTGPGGDTLYYITDPVSLAAFGQIEDVRAFKEITPISNAESDVVAAADNLYDAARAWLDRYSQEVKTYSLRVRKVNTLLRPGDKIRVFFSGVAEGLDGIETYLEVDETFYVMKVSETFGQSPYADIDVATVDRFYPDSVRMVAETIKAAEMLAVKPLPSSFVFQDQSVQPIGTDDGFGGTEAVMLFNFSDLMLDVTHAIVTFRLEGSTDVTFELDNTDLTSALGGPWDAPGTFTIDITQYIKSAGKGIRTLTWGGSAGMILAILQVLGTSQAIK